MNFIFDTIGKTSSAEISSSVKQILTSSGPKDEKQLASLALSCIDLTTLDGNDNKETIVRLCKKGIEFIDKGLSAVAAVCVYPNFIDIARKELFGSGIKVACVAGGFPSAQGMLKVKSYEVRMAREEGADEIDIVFPRSYLLAGEFNAIADELGQLRSDANDTTLKVILETGELKDPHLICMASELAAVAGADFLKTSTGKASIGYTPEALYVMLKLVKEYDEKFGRKIGVKAAGGVAEPDSAFECLKLTQALAGNQWLTPGLFRIGASRLAEKLKDILV